MTNKEDFNLSPDEINTIINEESNTKNNQNTNQNYFKDVNKDDLEKAKKELIKNVQLTRRIYKEYVDIKLTYVNDKFEKFKTIFDDLDKKYKFLYLNFKDIEKKIYIIFKTLIKLKKFHPEYENTDYSNINNISDNTYNNNLNNLSDLSNTKEKTVNNNINSCNNKSNAIKSNINLSINSDKNTIDNSNNTNSIKFNIKSQNSKLNKDIILDNNNFLNNSDEEEFNHKERKKKTNTINNIPYKFKIFYVFKSNNKNSLIEFYNTQKNIIDKLNNKYKNTNLNNSNNINAIDEFLIFEEKEKINCFYCYIKFRNRRKLSVYNFNNMEFIDINGKSNDILYDLHQKYKLIYNADDESPQKNTINKK